jgi:serpin B
MPADPTRSADATEVVASCNRFALDLYAQLARQPGNLFFSPASLASALAMTYAGAGGQTAEELAQVLHWPFPDNCFHEGFRDLWKATRTGGAKLRSANRLWGQRGYHFLPEFLETTERCYGARFAEVDFRAAAEQARRQINAWVEEQTVQKIRDLIPPGLLDSMTRLVLTNASYFKGSWQHEFDEALTREAPFWNDAGTEHRVPMMRQMEAFRYGEFDGLQVLEMPYLEAQVEVRELQDGLWLQVAIPDSGSDLAMCLLLPRRKDGLAELEASLNATALQQWTTLRAVPVEASIPRFRMESSFLLSGALRSLGMQQAFSRDEADFSRMSDDPEGLFISEAIHKAFVDVNEKGTEAAAATAVMMTAGCAVERPEPRIFVADHPFLFLIRDRATRLVHFLGRFVSPQ